MYTLIYERQSMSRKILYRLRKKSAQSYVKLTREFQALKLISERDRAHLFSVQSLSSLKNI